MASFSNFLSRMQTALTAPLKFPSFLSPSPSQQGLAVQPEEPTPELARDLQVQPHESGRPVFTTWTTKRAVEEGLKASHIVYSCVSLLASAGASVPWYTATKNGKGEWDRDEVSDVEDLLEQPNEFMDRQIFMERGLNHLLIGGNAIFLKVRPPVGPNKGKVTELWPIQPDWIKPVPADHLYLSHYLFKNSEKEFPISPRDIIHIQFCDPANMFWGMSPLQAMTRIVDTDVDMVSWWRWSLRNRAVKDGILQYKSELTREQYDLIKAQLVEQVMGPYNARIPLVLGNESTFTPTSMTPVEMDFINSRKLNKEEICGVYGVPPILIGAMDHSSYNNIITARLILWFDRVMPLLDKFGNAFDRALMQEFGYKRNRKRCFYDTSNVPALIEHFYKQVDCAEKLWKMGLAFNSLNRRLKLGFQPEAGHDTGYLPSSYVPTEDLALQSEMTLEKTEIENDRAKNPPIPPITVLPPGAIKPGETVNGNGKPPLPPQAAARGALPPGRG